MLNWFKHFGGVVYLGIMTILGALSFLKTTGVIILIVSAVGLLLGLAAVVLVAILAVFSITESLSDHYRNYKER